MYVAPFSHLPDSFALGKFEHFPRHLARAVRREWLRLRNRPLRAPAVRMGVLDDGREAEANVWLRHLVEQFPAQALELGASEDALVAFAIEKATEGERLRVNGASLDELEAYCEAHGLPLPQGQDNEAIARRVGCSLWWRRNLRKANGRKAEALSLSLGLVHKQRALYCSDDAVNRRADQTRRNRALLEALVAINELGEEFSLAELADKGTSNPAVKRAELMTRIAGFEYIAQAMEMAGEFITLTAPSRYHPRVAKTGRRNQHYLQGITPTDTRNYLGTVWSRITAALDRAGIRIFGFRVAEPHHDGTPHFHGLFFMSPADVPAFRRIVARYAVREDRQELGLSYATNKATARALARERKADGAKGYLADLMEQVGWEALFWSQPPRGVWKAIEARICFKAIDWNKGTAAGYIAKYVAKNIDGVKTTGESIGEDYEAQSAAPLADEYDAANRDTDASRTVQRVDAWAATWGIRQFQQVGGPPVGVWRELRRWDYMSQDAEDVMMRAAAAADAGNWGRFVEVMGGWEAKRKDMPLTLAKQVNEPTNRYGEPAQPAAFGVVEKESGQLAISRMHEWKVFHGREAAAWTRVNNSTESSISAIAPAQPQPDFDMAGAIEAMADYERQLAIQPPDHDPFLLPAQVVAKRTASDVFDRQRQQLAGFAAGVEELIRHAEALATSERESTLRRVRSQALHKQFAAGTGAGIQIFDSVATARALAEARAAAPAKRSRVVRGTPSLSNQLTNAITAAKAQLQKLQANPAWH
ncbi:replication endonuclease [Vogesella indigofera]|uniref:replication endonuclease n=1 Tax=Vogesella indigofera TaxID=45465 RepID=UPI00234FA9C4|nr:replication endonuclease [Vogesella indigofera]MDC7699561.1 replication endonuclease [Vogesella indigofera]